MKTKHKIKRSGVWIALFLLVTAMAIGPKTTFKMVWESQFANSANVYAASCPTGDHTISSTKTEICYMDGKTGKVVWEAKFKEISNEELSSVNYQVVLWDANILLAFDNKAGMDRIAAIDILTGKMLWMTDKYKYPKPKKNTSGDKMTLEDMIAYIEPLKSFAFSTKESVTMIDARTGEEHWKTDRFKGAIGKWEYLPESEDLIMLNYKPSGMAAMFAGFKNQIVRMDARTGKIKWEATYVGMFKKEVLTREPLTDIVIRGEKVYITLGGLQVYNKETGALLWSAFYQPDMGAWKKSGGGSNLKAGIYGAIAEPLVDKENQEVYIVLGDDKMKNKYITKYNAKGEVLWTSEKVNKANAIPNIHKVGNTIVVQIGGLVNLQRITKVKVDDGFEIQRVNEYIWLGKYGIAGIDASTGKTLWRSEKFDKRITDIVTDDEAGRVYAGSGDEFYCFDAKTGEMLLNVDHKAAKVGKGMFAFDIDGGVAMVCDKGVAAYTKDNAKLMYSTDKFKGVMSYVIFGDNMFLQNKKWDLAGIDLSNGNIKGIASVKPSKYSKNEAFAADSPFSGGVDISDDGNKVFIFQKKKVSLYMVN